MVRHQLITIGPRGQKRAYLDISVREAVQRYARLGGCDPIEAEASVEVIEFHDEFELYDAWPVEGGEPRPTLPAMQQEWVA